MYNFLMKTNLSFLQFSSFNKNDYHYVCKKSKKECIFICELMYVRKRWIVKYQELP
uniref:Uncharacterized protein n=1 Tax=Lepeophtheirus salmonis TaxID=72036 RepID=A0A0K2THV0_LEPSM